MNARDDAVEMVRRICPAHLSAAEYGQMIAGKFDAYRAEVLRESAAEVAALRARVAELETERHSTNEALSDAAEALRANRDRLAELTRRRTEDLALRGELAPMGGPRAVPMELGESLLPAVRWLVARVGELEAQAGDGHTRTVDEDPLPIALTQPTDVTAGQWATAIDAAGLRPGPAFAARYVTGEYDAAVHIATSPMLTDDARQELIEELITAVEATINRVLCTRTVRVIPPAPLSQTAAEVLEERSTPWVGDQPEPGVSA